LKYDRDVSFAKPLATLLIERFREDFTYDAIVPVPLHLSRLRWRGFNQAVVLGKPLSANRLCPMHALALERVRPTLPQVGLGGEERRRNMANAFRVRPAGRFSGKSVLLIDDIYTTGATADECAKVLRRAGASSVDVAVLARAM
jgi:ComF family protein